YETVVVVGVLANDVDATRGDGDRPGRIAEGFAERRSGSLVELVRCAHVGFAILVNSQSRASFGSSASGRSGSVRASRSNRHVRMPIVGRPFLSASAISDRVPSPPPSPTTPSAVLASTAFRPWPRLVAIALSMHSFASF